MIRFDMYSDLNPNSKYETSKCLHCLGPYSAIEALKYKRIGYCGKRCKRYAEKKSKKWKNGKDRNIKRINRRRNLNSFYDSSDWKKIRFKALRKYGYSCMACGRNRKDHNVVMHVDHIKPRSTHPALELEFSNLQVLCADCNVGKSNLSSDDLRPNK